MLSVIGQGTATFSVAILTRGLHLERPSAPLPRPRQSGRGTVKRYRVDIQSAARQRTSASPDASQAAHYEESWDIHPRTVGGIADSGQGLAMAVLIITEKSSQARDLRAALGDRFGQILPAEGHLLRLAEPHEVNAAWKNWSSVLLKPDDLYPTHAAPRGQAAGDSSGA